LERDSLYIAIWAKYSGSDQGMIRHYYVHFGDDVAPLPVNFSDSASTNRIWISWVRPTDQRDFYFPDVTDGPIAGYNIVITAQAGENIRDASAFATLGGVAVNDSIKRFKSFEKEGRNTILKNTSTTPSNYLRLAIADGEGYNINDALSNNWRLEISGLRPERSYGISIEAWDIAGNSSGKFTREKGTTDNIPPLIASEFAFDLDTNDNLPRLDSNRLTLKWQKSMDPLLGGGYREVKSYEIEQWNGSAWELDTSSYDIIGDSVSHILHRVSPGEEITLRIRAVDSSGHYSNAWVSTFKVSMGEFFQTKCPENFMPVKKDSETIFCMEKFQHFNGNEFERNFLYIEAKRACESLSFDGFELGLCTEQEWNAACLSRGSSYGVIEETGFLPNVFLPRHCGTRTEDSIPAKFVNERDRFCVSPDGIRDLPGQLQEWVIGNSDSGEVAILKGTSYAKFTGGSIVELAQCRNVSIPTLVWPKYTTDTAYVYKNGSRYDTLQFIDTLRILYKAVPPTEFKDTILIYSIESKDGDALGQDIVDKKEYNRRGGDEGINGIKWLDVRWKGLEYEKIEEKQVLILGEETVMNKFFLNPTVGFRCCAREK
jgi:hypothetical protein